MNILNLFKVSLRAVANNKMRSFLSMLGIIIGVAAVIIMIISCFVMLSIQSRVNEQEWNIEQMQEQAQQLEANNIAQEDALESKYSLNQIYDVATKELGMVYSQRGQIVYYEGANEDYVKQMMDVPEAK